MPRSLTGCRLRYPLHGEALVNDLDIEGLVGSVLRGALGGGRKRKRGALNYLAVRYPS